MDILATVRTRLLRTGKTIAVAESCTGGALSKLLTDQAGSSGYFVLGVVTYSNRAKIKLLGIPAKTLATHGAVSQASALAMARKVRTISRADFGIGITGIAGPGGGSKEKPVGTVFIAAASKQKTLCKKFHSKGPRERIRTQATLNALMLLLPLL